MLAAMRRTLEVKERYKYQLLSIPGVVSVGIGTKSINNVTTNQLSIVVGVVKKLPREGVIADEFIPGSLDSVPVDVIEVGRAKFFRGRLKDGTASVQRPESREDPIRTRRVRPAPPGVSIGHFRVTAGTLGAVVKGLFPGGIAILSNNHVLANSTNGRDGRSSLGDLIFQPGRADGGTVDDAIARLAAFSPMEYVSLKAYESGVIPPPNLLDAALAVPLKPYWVTDKILGLGPVRGIAKPYLGMRVVKSGLTTGITYGSIIRIFSSEIVVDEDLGLAFLYEDQIVASNMDKAGDSGSLVLDCFGRAVGLLFAGSENETVMNPIGAVLNTLNISL